MATTPKTTIPPPSHLAALPDAQVGLLDVMALHFPHDDALHRASERLRRMRYVHPPLEFDGLQATFQSSSKGSGEEHIVALDETVDPETGAPVFTIACSCPGHSWPWCIHRLRFRIELADLALRDPVMLLTKIRQQSPAPILRVPHAGREPVAPPRRTPEEPPPPEEADRRDAGVQRPAHLHPARAAARAEAAAALAAIEGAFPL